jgi:hypothetical protein
MDCKGWGSSGWNMLHTIAVLYDEGDFGTDSNSFNILKKFFSSVQHVLPCTHCRRSYRQYIKESPIDEYESHSSIFKFVYDIHNKVNDKLRDQGHPIPPNPRIKDVYHEYRAYNNRQNFLKSFGKAWNFLYCIVLNYPVTDKDISKRRYDGHLQFFITLGKLLSSLMITMNKNIYKDKKLSLFSKTSIITNAMKTRDAFVKWLYEIECSCKTKVCSYKNRCKKFEKYRVKKCINNTCRRNNNSDK